MRVGQHHYNEHTHKRCGPVYTAYARQHQRWFPVGYVCLTCWAFWHDPPNT